MSSPVNDPGGRKLLSRNSRVVKRPGKDAGGAQFSHSQALLSGLLQAEARPRRVLQAWR